MLAGLGVDIVKIDRIIHVWKKFGDKFLDKILTDKEKKVIDISPTYIAGRWAAKEAAAKALGIGFTHGLMMRDIEILSGEEGCPMLFFYNLACIRKNLLNVSFQYVSISHEKEFAVAVVVLER